MKKIRFILILIICLLIFGGCFNHAELSSPNMVQTPEISCKPEGSQDPVRILFVNVHKADAVLVANEGSAFLVDTGTAESAPLLIGAIESMGIQSLDGIFLSHTHKDHIGGFPFVAREFPVGMAYRSLISENKKDASNAIDNAAGEEGVPLFKLSAGDSKQFGNVDLEVLGPLEYNSNDDNDNSLVLMLKTYGRKILLTGDMQFAEEATLLSNQIDLHSDILKVGNHGNPDATSPAFAKAVSPSLAIISTDTAVDEDSANQRVVAALSGAETLTTEGTNLGILVTIYQDGEIDISYPDRLESNKNAEIGLDIDRAAQSVLLKNMGSEHLDLAGWMLLSEQKKVLFRFPKGAVLEPGEECIVSQFKAGGQYSFREKDKPFNKKKQNRFLLYDKYGNLITEQESEAQD